jgi:V-type H+-transporting ATPase subunit a
MPTSFSPQSIETSLAKPPTFIRTNDFTAMFQEIVNTYGIPRYQEINPALFVSVTFPFLFGVMFGDIGHGFLLLLFGIYLCVQKDEILRSKSLLSHAVRARYLLLLMGIFSFYCGWMYNDFLSMSFPAFGASCYTNNHDGSTKQTGNCVYPFGLDPKWNVASNELTFINSLKMKLSVILGIFQMCMGIFLKGMNAVYFGSTLDFVFEFIPQLVFMLSLFGYMIFMIFLKWATDWTGRTSAAPSLVTQLMNIFLKLGDVQGKPLWGDGSLQLTINRIVLVIVFVCVPILLFPKPIIIYMDAKKKKQHRGEEPVEQERNYNIIVEDKDVNI